NTLTRKTADGNLEQSQLRYDAKDRLTQVMTGETTSQSFTYNANGQPLVITGDGPTRSYTYAANGDILSQQNGETLRNFTYSADGLLRSLSENGQTAKFDYNKTGKLAKVTFVNKATHEYQYNALGFRTKTTRSDGSSLSYDYDSVGNFKGATATNEQGQTKHTQVKLDKTNKVEQYLLNSELAMSVDYADKANPAVVTHGEDRIEYDYDRFGRLTSVNDGASEPITYKYAPGEPDLRHQLDHRTAQITLANQDHSLNTILYTRTQITPWPHIQWDEKLGVLSLVNDKGIIPPDAAIQSADKRRRLYDALATIKTSQIAFDKPSNSWGVPPEYQTVNCDP
ncbi:MAG: hypothetical protein MJK04_05860, partial [Psychrosphaera sp.]|nr:hypothetical protein [Psychrosphaera sp.]